jgi:hypothetical protein
MARSETTTMENFLYSIYANKFEDDVREPELLFTVPYGTFGITGVDPMFWIQLLILILLLQTIVNVAVAVVVYTWIVKQRGSLSAYLVGYGFVCPFLLYVPFYLIRFLDLHNTAFKLASAAGTTLLVFRTLEAMHGTMPPFAYQSMANFVFYYTAAVQYSSTQRRTK